MLNRRRPFHNFLFPIINSRRNWYSTLTEKGSALDIDYFMSLAERPTDNKTRPQSFMTPDRWPDLAIRSTLYQIPRNDTIEDNDDDFGNDPFMFEGLNNTSHEGGGGGDEYSLDEVTNMNNVSFETVIDNHLGRTRRKEETSMVSIEKLRSILRDINGEVKLSPDMAGPKSTEKISSYVSEIQFIDLEKKTISSILSKTLGLDEESGESSMDATETEAVESNVSEIKSMPVIEEFSVKAKLILSGFDLHLLEYHQLIMLTTLYNIEAKDSRSSLEKALCKKMKQYLEDANVKVERINYLVDKDEPIQVFAKKDLRKNDPETGMRLSLESWTQELDQKLFTVTEKVRDARRVIVGAVDKYLQELKLPVPEIQKSEENTSLWEVVSLSFPGSTPKGCRKRWHLLHRMKCMESQELA